MKLNLAMTALVLAGFAALPACAVDAAPSDADEAASSQDDLTAAAQRLIGAFHGGDAGQFPSFDGLVFNGDGTFFGDLDTGIRCITAPCPSSAHVEGTYTATKSTVTITAKAGAKSSELYGRYNYTLSDSALSLSRTNAGSKAWTQKLGKGDSYCAQASDCSRQGLFHPQCAPGGWTCGEANTCGFKCGVEVASIWPADATKLVAQSSGSGFGPPPPPGSTCAIGHVKYTLDRTTRAMSYETCDFVSSTQPLTLKKGTTTLTVAELAKVSKAMAALKVATVSACGADKPLLRIEVATPAGAKSYTDSFYRCEGGSTTYVDGIDAVFGALRAAE